MISFIQWNKSIDTWHKWEFPLVKLVNINYMGIVWKLNPTVDIYEKD